MTASEFTITPTPPTSIKVARGERGTFSFTITSLAAPDKIHEVIVQAQRVRDDGKGTDADWLVAGPARNMTVEGGKTVTVTITARPTASTPIGAHNLKLVVASQAAPDDEYVDSPIVACEVTEQVVAGDKPGGKPNWLLIAAIAGGAVVLLGGALVLWLVLRSPALPGVGEPCNKAGACATDLVCAGNKCLLAAGAACKPDQAAQCVSGECPAARAACAIAPGGACSPDDKSGPPCTTGMICDPGTRTCRAPDPCGDRGIKCCTGATPCNGRNICGSGGLCVECGARGGACCPGATPCAGTDICGPAGTCTACGLPGGACCPGATPCTGQNLCSGGVCTGCGTSGARCCPGATPCGSALICGSGGLCTACGGVGQPCCSASTCNSPSVCLNQACHFFEVGTAEQTIPGGGGTGGTVLYSLRCAANEVAIGFHGRFGTILDAAGIVCAVLNKNGTIGSAHNSSASGGGGGSPFNVQCPSGMVLTGAAGRSGTLVDALIGHCSTVARAAGIENSGTRDIGPFGGGGGAPFDRSCPANHVMIGITGKSGTLVDKISFLCRPLVFR